jgi:CheY-like chemotaxis protein
MHEDAFEEYERAGRVIVGALLVGILALVVFSLQAAPGGVVSVLSVLGAGLALVGAASALGAVIGFLFGIPRRLQEAQTAPANDQSDVPASPGLRWAGNTSLEQISDWLTKIIVGVGLTQLLNLPDALGSLGRVVGPALGGFSGSATFGTLEFVFFMIGGFFTAYLWTSLRLTSLLVSSEEDAKRAQAHELDLQIRAIELATNLQEANTPTSAGRGPDGIDGKGPAAEPPRPGRILWVDDRPSNNAREIKQLREQGFDVESRTDSSSALEELKQNPGGYDVVITDLKRDFDREAGFKFLRDAGAAAGSKPSFIVYTLSSNPDLDVNARRHGAIGGTNSPIRLFELVNQSMGLARPAATSGPESA